MSIDVFSESAEFKKAVEQAASDIIKRETRACPRYYKAIVTAAPYTDEILGNVCQVRLVGDETVLTLPYSSCADLITVGDLVWVQTTYDSFRNAVVLIKTNMRTESSVPPKHYGARWDKVQAQMTRLYDAEDFPTDTSNFGHFGSVNPNYNNPFDNIYPWSEIKLCNIDINLYMNLTEGQSVTECVTAWEGDPDFSYEDQYGVWRYHPPFYGKSWEDDTYRYFDVCAEDLGEYVFYQEEIVGRWNGSHISMTVGGANTDLLLPSLGMPAKRISMETLHQYAKNFNASLESIYSIDSNALLLAVEYATMNSQNAIGQGVCDLNRQQSDLIVENATDSFIVKVSSTGNQSSFCIPGAIFDIGTVNAGVQVGSFIIESVQDNGTTLSLTLNEKVTVTTANYWSVHGLSNVADSEIGSSSGYIGTNGKCNSYYRGIVMFSNMFRYVLGAYYRGRDRTVWLSQQDPEGGYLDQLDTSVHTNTGIVLISGTSLIKTLSLSGVSNILSIPAFCTVGGGNSINPVGDAFWTQTSSVNTILLVGGHAGDLLSCGMFYFRWSTTATEAGGWGFSARPRLKNP